MLTAYMNHKYSSHKGKASSNNGGDMYMTSRDNFQIPRNIPYKIK